MAEVVGRGIPPIRAKTALGVAAAAAVALFAVSYVLAASLTVGEGMVSDLVGRVIAAVVTVGGVAFAAHRYRTAETTPLKRSLTFVAAIVLSVAVGWGYLVSPKVRTTVISVLVAVGVSAVLFVGANVWFNQALKDWRRFGAITGAAAGGAIAIVLTGNRLIGLKVGESDASTLWVFALLVIILAAVTAAYGWLITGISDARTRLLVGAGGGAVLGVVFGLFARNEFFPAMKALHLVLWPVLFAAAGYLVGRQRGRAVVPAAITGATLGWLVGAWLVPSIGRGTFAEAILGTAVLGLGVGAAIGTKPLAVTSRRAAIEQKARAFIFVGPALVFISGSLVIPTIRTIYLSFFDARSENFIGLENYAGIISDRQALDWRTWTGAFSSRLFLFACVSIVLAILAAARFKIRSEGRAPAMLLATAIPVGVAFVAGLLARLGVEDIRNQVPAVSGLIWIAALATVASIVMLVAYAVTNRRHTGFSEAGSPAALGIGIILFAFALFGYFRGTIFNNLWWVFTVTLFATGLGLAIAVLADRGKYENVAKSIIFMPMAISFVGAGIIWRFVFIARPDAQTGMLNAAWVGLGNVSQSSTGRAVAVAILALVFAALAYIVVKALGGRSSIVATIAGAAAVFVVYLIYRFLGPGLGGIEQDIGDLAFERTVLFTQEPPWNNVWLMVVLIWIQTGFTMVIFSAAIKAVPADLIEASKVDGAVESQTFFRVVLPQIAPTIGVVITTLIVLVMKVFDIVKVMGNGNFGTQVIANQMFDQAFAKFNIGAGSAWAVVLFAAILPVMVINVRRMQKEAR